MTQSEFNFIKDAFSQILDDIAGNPDWHDAASAVASNLGTLERQLKEKVVELPSDLDEAAEEYSLDVKAKPYENLVKEAFKDGSKWRDAQIPKLPDNVDEAADTFAHNGDVNGVGGEDYEDDLRITFKAGAEWMAGQGETRIVRANADLDPHGADYGIRYLDIRVEDDIPVGTKFIVQIRKKQ